MSKINNNHSKSYTAGFRWAKKAVKENHYNNSFSALSFINKSAETCKKYATDKYITETKNGKKLTSSVREYYRGAANAFFQEYNGLVYDLEKENRKK